MIKSQQVCLLVFMNKQTILTFFYIPLCSDYLHHFNVLVSGPSSLCVAFYLPANPHHVRVNLLLFTSHLCSVMMTGGICLPAVASIFLEPFGHKAQHIATDPFKHIFL